MTSTREKNVQPSEHDQEFWERGFHLQTGFTGFVIKRPFEKNLEERE